MKNKQKLEDLRLKLDCAIENGRIKEVEKILDKIDKITKEQDIEIK